MTMTNSTHFPLSLNLSSTPTLPVTTVKFPFGDKPYPPVIKKIGFSILPAIIVTSVIGNSLVIHLTHKYALLKGVMKAFVINIAVCNILLCFFPLLYLFELGTGDWYFGSIGCDILVVFEYAVLTSANLSLVHIALERLCAIVKPFKVKVDRKNGTFMLIFSWLIGFPLAIPFVILQPRYTDDDHPDAAAQPECNNMWAVTTVGMSRGSLIYYCAMFVLLYIVPSIIVTMCYTKIIYVLIKKIKRPGHQTKESKRQEQRRKLRTVKLLLITVAIFKLFWLPSYVQEFLLAGGVENVDENLKIQIINLVCASLGYLYCAVTPFLYFLYNEQYRNSLWQMGRSVAALSRGSSSSKNAYSLKIFSTPGTKRKNDNVQELGIVNKGVEDKVTN
ncbi:substance-K receptor-like [Rhopilema esculentum]|uniref:substance-K receptor-like n=1 Tax=Rhopilema esculentum TaxID=499914 RepID=UPI0031D51FA0